MRKLIIAALFVFAVTSFAGASISFAADCGPKCSQDTCTTCKPDCEKACKPKCDPCKPKCEKACKPKCDPCKPKCEKACKPKCKPICEGKWVGGFDACCPPKAPVQTVCLDKCQDPCGPAYKHPFEQCWSGTGMLCDTGCGTFLPGKRKCVECETICKKVETVDSCTGCVSVEYVTETVCHELTRPTVIPWWFNEQGDGNIYIGE